MLIMIDVPNDTIANMLISAIESGDPVTTASRGGWCSGIDLVVGTPTTDPWYADPTLWGGKFQIKITEVDDEETGHETAHFIGPTDITRGLTVMASKFPAEFAQVLSGDTDAPCSDILLQCVLFGEARYA